MNINVENMSQNWLQNTLAIMRYGYLVSNAAVDQFNILFNSFTGVDILYFKYLYPEKYIDQFN
jgi:hypothetical protein